MSWYEDAMDYADKLAEQSGCRLSWEEQAEIGKVLNFIGRLHAKAGSDNCLSDIFENGYCYYFAKMLDAAFPFEGTVVWIRNRGHIVWKSDNTNICYDINGIYVNFESDEDLLPIEKLGAMLCDFEHTGVEFKHWNADFNDWCDNNGFKPIYAAAVIYKYLPQLSEVGYDEWDESFRTILGAVSAFWMDSDENKEKCLEAIKGEMKLDEAMD